MYCNSCGKEISDSAAICIHCGVATEVANKQPEYKPIVGFVLSIILGFVGLIVSIIEFRKAKRVGGVASFALAGIIIGAVSTVISIISYIVIIPMILEMMDEIATMCLMF